jgi:hypothetical protein
MYGGSGRSRYVAYVGIADRLWEHPEFAHRTRLEEAELVAFDVLEPALWSRGGIHAASKELSQQPDFNQEMVTLFRAPPAGRVALPTLPSALARISELERRVAELEERLRNSSAGAGCG